MNHTTPTPDQLTSLHQTAQLSRAAQSDQSTLRLQAPYLIFIGDCENPAYAKTGRGIIQWRPELVAGQLRFAGTTVDLGVPDMSIKQAKAAGVKSLVTGVSPIGGAPGADWIAVFNEAAEAGLDIVSGLHTRLHHIPGLAAIAQRSGAQLIDVRTAPQSLAVASGKKRCGRRLLMVGTDCAVGKKYAALALSRAMKERGFSVDFCATGQTGIMIAGKGLAIDSVVCDFTAGAAECISPDNDAEHWDVIEGQGSLLHPAYAGVSLGLLHGSQPDAIVVCHDPSRTHLLGWPGFAVPDVTACIKYNLEMGALTNPDIRCVGVCINSASMSPVERKAYAERLSECTGLPCVDPMLDSLDPIISRLQ